MRIDRRATFLASVGLALTLTASAAAADQPLPSPEQRWAEGGEGGTPGFTRHIVPLFGKLGCNNRACHGSFQGQNGFRLSLFGFEPEADRQMLLKVEEKSGARVNVKSPADSLALRKPSRQVPHKGGQRMEVDGWEYRMFRQWIADGAKYDGKEPHLVRFELTPREIVLRETKAKATLRTVAHFSDGTSEDVTALTIFTTNDQAVATVSDSGEVTAARTGDTAIVAQYSGGVASTRVIVPVVDDSPFPPFPPHNKVDELVLAKLRKLNIRPSELASDEVFLRRVYLDLIGTLPTADEARKFLAERDPGKRARLIDELLERPEYAVYWGMKFADWTGAGYIMNPVAATNWWWQAWLEDKLSRNVPYDQLVHGYICATTMEGRPREEVLAEAKGIYHRNSGRGEFELETYARRQTLDLYWLRAVNSDPATIALQTANAFLGLRLECAQCHNHPFDRWTQKDYEGFKSFFMFVRFCDPETGKEGAVNPMFGRGWVESGLNRRWVGQVKRFPPKLLGGAVVPQDTDKDPRLALWEWMRAPDNDYFAPALVNRLWAHYLGRGIVHAADDFNQGNPPSNPALLDWLAKDFIAGKFDLSRLHRTILNSRTYQLSWRPNASNKVDATNYSHAPLRRLEAEVLMDAVVQVTGVPDQFAFVPRGRDRRTVGQASPPFLHSIQRAGFAMRVFGRPDRAKACDCERSNEPSVGQALYLINDEQMHAKIASPTGRLAQLLKEIPDDRQLIEELYLSALSRYPTAEEMKAQREHLAAAPSRIAGMQDVLWSLLNVREFVFNH